MTFVITSPICLESRHDAIMNNWGRSFDTMVEVFKIE